MIFPPLSIIDVARALFVVATAGFLPGFFLYAKIFGKKSWREAFAEDFFEGVAASAIISFVLLALASALLTFTIGFSFAAIAVLEMAIIVLAYLLWKKK